MAPETRTWPTGLPASRFLISSIIYWDFTGALIMQLHGKVFICTELQSQPQRKLQSVFSPPGSSSSLFQLENITTETIPIQAGPSAEFFFQKSCSIRFHTMINYHSRFHIQQIRLNLQKDVSKFISKSKPASIPIQMALWIHEIEYLFRSPTHDACYFQLRLGSAQVMEPSGLTWRRVGLALGIPLGGVGFPRLP